MPSAFDPTTTPGSMSTNVAVVSGILPAPYGDGSTRVPLGVTKGGADFESESKMRQPEYDGRRHFFAGGDEYIEHGPSKMTFTVVEFPAKVLGYTTPGATTDGDTTTPLAAGTQITKGMLIEAPWHELTLKDGTIIRHEFDYGIVVTPPKLSTKDKDEASMQVTIEARVDPDRVDYSPDLADFRRVVTPA